MITKTCTKCKQTKPATAEHFGPDKCSKDGYQAQCRMCRRLARQAYGQTERGKATQQRYAQSKNGKKRAKESRLRCRAKRG